MWDIDYDCCGNYFMNLYNNKECFRLGKIIESKSIGVMAEILFDHDFAKAFWGDTQLYKCTKCETEYTVDDISECINVNHKINPVTRCKNTDFEMSCKSWERRIQELAISKDRLEYISKFIEIDK